MMAAGPTTTTTGGRNNVLSDKVNRALHVRTDTPSMRTALDALSNLQASEDNDAFGSVKKAGSGSGGAVIDAKSVRAAIEKDALRRALEFQTELQKLARDATKLRERVDNVAKVCLIFLNVYLYNMCTTKLQLSYLFFLYYYITLGGKSGWTKGRKSDY